MIRFAPCGVESECKSVETHHEALSEAKPVTTSCSTSGPSPSRTSCAGTLRRSEEQAYDGLRELHGSGHHHGDPGRSGRATRLSLTATRRTLRTISTRCRSSTGGRAKSLRLRRGTSRTATLHLSLSSRRSAVRRYVHGVPPLGRIAVRDMKQTVAVGATKAVTPKQAAASKKKTTW